MNVKFNLTKASIARWLFFFAPLSASLSQHVIVDIFLFVQESIVVVIDSINLFVHVLPPSNEQIPGKAPCEEMCSLQQQRNLQQQNYMKHRYLVCLRLWPINIKATRGYKGWQGKNMTVPPCHNMFISIPTHSSPGRTMDSGLTHPCLCERRCLKSRDLSKLPCPAYSTWSWNYGLSVH